MAKKRISGILKVLTVMFLIIFGSAWIGLSINRRFLSGPQKSTFTLKQVNGSPVFVPSDPTPYKTSVTHERIELNELKALISRGGVVLVDGRAVKDFVAGHIPSAYNLPALDLEAFPRNLPPRSLMTNY